MDRSSGRRSRRQLQKNLEFVQQLHPSPLSNDFVGDVSFVAEGSDQPIQAHRFILASKSPVFRVMMEIGMKENSSGIIRIEGVSAAIIRAVVNFMYTSEIDFNDQVDPKDVLKFAHQYDIPWLKELCEIELAKTITALNLSEIIAICNQFDAERLKDEAGKFVTNHHLNLTSQTSKSFHQDVLLHHRRWDWWNDTEIFSHTSESTEPHVDTTESEDEYHPPSFIEPIEPVSEDITHTSEIDFGDKVDLEDLKNFAHRYDIPWLKKHCDIQLAKTLSASICSHFDKCFANRCLDSSSQTSESFHQEKPQKRHAPRRHRRWDCNGTEIFSPTSESAETHVDTKSEDEYPPSSFIEPMDPPSEDNMKSRPREAKQHNMGKKRALQVFAQGMTDTGARECQRARIAQTTRDFISRKVQARRKWWFYEDEDEDEVAV